MEPCSGFTNRSGLVVEGSLLFQSGSMPGSMWVSKPREWIHLHFVGVFLSEEVGRAARPQPDVGLGLSIPHSGDWDLLRGFPGRHLGRFCGVFQ